MTQSLSEEIILQEDEKEVEKEAENCLLFLL
jgi:hypothetical protein